jgi:hypothetical protein
MSFFMIGGDLTRVAGTMRGPTQPWVPSSVIYAEHLGDQFMKFITLLAIAACGLTAACSVRSERTVVQPTPTTTTTAPVVYTDPPRATATTTTVYTPAR